MSRWEPKRPLTQTTEPSSASTSWAAGSAATVVSAWAMAGATRTASAARMAMRALDMAPGWRRRHAAGGHQGLDLPHPAPAGFGGEPAAGDRRRAGGRLRIDVLVGARPGGRRAPGRDAAAAQGQAVAGARADADGAEAEAAAPVLVR
jgi:hypothetical protein